MFFATVCRMRLFSDVACEERLKKYFDAIGKTDYGKEKKQ